jgi:hypothetical protein
LVFARLDRDQLLDPMGTAVIVGILGEDRDGLAVAGDELLVLSAERLREPDRSAAWCGR